MRRGGKEPELQVSAQEKPIVCGRMHGERACAALDKAASGRQHCSGISKKGLLAMHPAWARARPARDHSSVVAKECGGGYPLPRCPSSLPSCPAPAWGPGCTPLPRGCHCPLSALSAPIALRWWVFSRTPHYRLLYRGCCCAWLLFPFLVFFFFFVNAALQLFAQL